MYSTLAIAAILIIVALLASMISVELGVSVAIIEILAGMAVGNILHLGSPDWLVFLAGFASVVLTFLAGAEVDPAALRRSWKASTAIGALSFAAPFVAAMLACHWLFGWDWRAAQVGGIALSTTSLAVVYAVLVESGLNTTKIGQLIMSATFITDLGTVLALSLLFVRPTFWLVPFIAVSVALIAVMPRLERWFFGRYGNRVIEPEIKGAFAALLVLMWLGEKASSHAVLPAFLLGLAVSRTFERHRTTQQRFRVVAFALLTPFFFLNSGMKVSLPLVWANLGLLAVLLAVKLAAKGAAVYPLARRWAAPACRVHHAADVHRPDIWHHLRDLRPVRRDHHPGPVLRPGLRGRAHRGSAHRDRATLVRPAAHSNRQSGRNRCHRRQTGGAGRGQHDADPTVHKRQETREVRVRIEGPAVRLTIFVTRTDQYHWQSVVCQILFRAHKSGLAGATTVHAIAGYSGVGPIRTLKAFSLAQHLPAIIVIVDTEEKIRGFLPQLDELLTGGGLATIDPVEIIRYVGRTTSPPTPRA